MKTRKTVKKVTRLDVVVNLRSLQRYNDFRRERYKAFMAKRAIA